MRTFTPARIFFFSLLLIVTAQAHAIEPQRDMVQGKWRGTDTLPNGAKLETNDSLNSDGSFTGTGTVDAKPFWSYSGTWHLAGSKITMTFLNSSLPLPDAAKVNISEVLSVSENELVLKSEGDGKKVVLQRIRETPKIIVEKNGVATNVTAEGNLASSQTVACIPLSEAKNTFTPADIHKGLGECVTQGKYDFAVSLLMLADMYGLFDAARVTDKTAGQAILALRMNTFANVPQDKKAKLSELINHLASDTERRGKLCGEINKIGPPDYYPSYMILHGVKAFTGNPHEGALVKDFDAIGTWKKLQATSLKCPS